MSERDDARDAARYRWLRDTLHGAKCGGGVEVNDALQVYERPTPGEEVRVYWYDRTPVGFYEATGSTMDEAIDAAMRQEPCTCEADPLEITATGDRRRKYMCPKCAAKWEGPVFDCGVNPRTD